jgi:hypothetical protein
MKKLPPLLEELEKARKKYGLSMTALAPFVGCDPVTIYNWLRYRRTIPTWRWRKRIRRAINKIEAGEPIKPPDVQEKDVNLSREKEEITRTFDLVWPRLSQEEKGDLASATLHGIRAGGFTPAFQERLKKLAAAHGLATAEKPTTGPRRHNEHSYPRKQDRPKGPRRT